MNAEPAVHQITSVLAEFEPARLARLQDRYPGESALRPGRELGELSLPLTIRLELACEGLRAIVEKAEPLTNRLARRIRSSHRVEFIAQFIALVGSGGVLAAVLGEGSDQLKIVAALCGLLGSAIALAVKFMRRDLGGVENGLIAQHAELVKTVGRAVELEMRLQPHLRSGDDFGDAGALASVIDEANTLAGRFYVLVKQSGQRMPPSATATRP